MPTNFTVILDEASFFYSPDIFNFISFSFCIQSNIVGNRKAKAKLYHNWKELKLINCIVKQNASLEIFSFHFYLLVRDSSSLVQNFFIHLAGFRIWHWNASGPEIGRRHFGQAVFNMTENIFYYQNLLLTCFYWMISIGICLSIEILNQWTKI